MANLFDTGGGLPQTATPFAMDLSAPIMAITQRMVQARRQEIADDRSEIAKNEKVLLDALDFEPIQGLSDQIQTDHIKAVEDMTNEWAGKMAQYRGKLPPSELLNLKRAQRKMEMDISNKKSDVIALAKLKEEMAKEGGKIKDSYMDVNATAARVNDYIKAGKVGSGGASFLMVPRTYSGAEIYQARYGDQLEKLATVKDEKITDADGNVIGTTESTPEDIRAKAYAMADNDTTMTEAQKQQSKDYVEARLKSVLKEKYYQPRAVKAAIDRSGAAINAAEPANDLLDGVWNMDQGATANLKANALFQNSKWDMSNPKDPVIVLSKFDGGAIRVPRSVGEKRFKEIINENLADAIRIKKDAGNLIKTGGIPGKQYKIATPEEFTVFDNALSKYKEPMTDPTNTKGPKIPGHKFVEKMLKSKLPDGWKVERSIGRDIQVFSPEGKKYQFDYTKSEDAEALKEFYRKYSKQGAGFNELTGDKKEEADPLGIL